MVANHFLPRHFSGSVNSKLAKNNLSRDANFYAEIILKLVLGQAAQNFAKNDCFV